MKVHELITWLSKFEDQDAIVEVIEHSSDGGYYCQGGTIEFVDFDPDKHAEYTDLRGNKFIDDTKSYKDRRSLLLGAGNI